MPRFLLFAALLVTASACDSGNPGFTEIDSRQPQDVSLLAGTWEWERSYGCGDGGGGCFEATPRSTGRTETLTFTIDPASRDQSSGTVSGFFNGGRIEPTAYRADVGHADGRDRPYWFAHIGLGESSGYGTQFGVSRDRLVITSAPVDGEETTYRRTR